MTRPLISHGRGLSETRPVEGSETNVSCQVPVSAFKLPQWKRRLFVFYQEDTENEHRRMFPEAYIHSYITYPDKRRMKRYYTEMLIYVPWCLACLSAPPPLPAESTMEFRC